MVFTVSVHSQLGGTPAMGGAVGGMSSRLGGDGAGGGSGPVYGPVPSPAPLSPALHQPTDNNIIPQLQNIVSTVNMGVKLDLKKIALHARNAEFNPKRFAAVIMRIREPRTTALIFSSGEISYLCMCVCCQFLYDLISCETSSLIIANKSLN